MSKLIRILACGIVLTCVLTVEIKACTTPPPQPPPIWITFHGDDTAWIIFHNYDTHAAMPGAFCSCGLNQVGPITNVLSASVVFAGTMDPVPGWSFSLNATTSGAYNTAAGGGNWQGYFSNVSQSIPDLVDVDVMFHVQLAPGSTQPDLVLALQNANLLIGTGEANSNGTIMPQTLLPAGAIMQSTPIPAASDIGMIVLIGLAGLAGVIIIRRSRRIATA